MAEHARRQFEDSRTTLATVKDGLRRFARSVLVEQVNGAVNKGRIEKVVTKLVGQWEWCVELQRADAQPVIYLESRSHRRRKERASGRPNSRP